MQLHNLNLNLKMFQSFYNMMNAYQYIAKTATLNCFNPTLVNIIMVLTDLWSGKEKIPDSIKGSCVCVYINFLHQGWQLSQ